MPTRLSSGRGTATAERRTARLGGRSPAFTLQRTAGNRAVSGLIARASAGSGGAGDRRLLALASVQREPTRVRFIDPSQYERGDKPPGSGEPASMDPSAARLPVADTDPKVAVDDEDTQQCLLRPRSLVQGSPSYIDNGLGSVGADITDVWTIGIQALVFKTGSGAEVRVPLDEIDFDGTTPPARYVTRRGVTFPVQGDGRIVYNRMATPIIVQGAL